VSSAPLAPRRFLAWFFGTTLLALFLLSRVIVAMPMVFFDDAYPLWHYAKTARDSVGSKDARILVLGDSRGQAGLNPDVLGKDINVLAVPGVSPIELYYSFKHYLQHHQPPAKVVVSLSSTHFGFEQLFWERAIKFGYLDANETEEVILTGRRVGDQSLGRRSATTDAWFYRQGAPWLYFPELRAGVFGGRLAKNRELTARVAEGNGHVAYGTADASDGLAYEISHSTFKTMPATIEYLRILISLAKSVGARTEFISLPLNQASLRAMPAAHRDGFVQLMQQLQREMPSFTAHPQWPEYPNDHFGDPNHLNARGAARFSAEFLKQWSTP